MGEHLIDGGRYWWGANPNPYQASAEQNAAQLAAFAHTFNTAPLSPPPTLETIVADLDWLGRSLADRGFLQSLGIKP